VRHRVDGKWDLARGAFSPFCCKQSCPTVLSLFSKSTELMAQIHKHLQTSNSNPCSTNHHQSPRVSTGEQPTPTHWVESPNGLDLPWLWHRRWQQLATNWERKRRIIRDRRRCWARAWVKEQSFAHLASGFTLLLSPFPCSCGLQQSQHPTIKHTKWLKTRV
jgi:hypothetical protein